MRQPLGPTRVFDWSSTTELIRSTHGRVHTLRHERTAPMKKSLLSAKRTDVLPAVGLEAAVWPDERFQQHLIGRITWAMGR